MDEQLAFYSIVLNWSFSDNPDDIEAEEGEIKTNHNNYDEENTNHNSMLIDEISQPPLKKRKISINKSSNLKLKLKLKPLTIPPPLEPNTNSNSDPFSTPPLKSQSQPKSPLSPLVMKIPKISNDKKQIEKLTQNNGPNAHNNSNLHSQPSKKARFKRAVTLKSKANKSSLATTISPPQTLDYNELFPVEKFRTITKFHRNETKAEQLSKICTFPNVLSYKEHFGSLLFDDLRARLDNQIRDETKSNWKNARDMLPAEIINDIGHNEYICSSFQILSNTHNWMYKVNTKMLVLILYNLPENNNHKNHTNNNRMRMNGKRNNLNGKRNNFKGKHSNKNKLVSTHILGIIDEPPSATHIKVQIHLHNGDERYEPFINCFDSEKIKRRSMKIVFLDNIQNRMREFRAICNVDKLRLKDIIIDPKAILLQDKFCSQKPEYFSSNSTLDNGNGNGQSGKGNSKWVWAHVPDAYRKRLGRYLNSSQCKAIEKACQNKGITLLQGPPGTGKTRTVLHLMNAFHIAKTQAMFQSWLKTMYNRFHSNNNNNKQDVLPINKPRIMVGAPSNAAVDEIIIRLMEQQFVDGNDFKYRPPITRIGNMEKCRIEVGKQVSLHSKVDAFLQHRYNNKTDQQTNINKLNDRIRFFQNKKIEMEKKLSQFIKSHLIEFREIDFESFQMNETGKIIHFLQEIHNNSLELQRCIWVKTLSKKAAKDRLIISILLESEIIFTTLNSAGGRELRLLYEEHKESGLILNNNNQLFDHCIIDEAGQCTEPDILIPLIFDIDSVVLVGDPQQLPATVFASGPSAWLYERSLFERLMSTGYPVHLLDTQYRMHPEIAYFPNQHFYNNKLKNGNNVLGPKYVFNFHNHISELYKPFLFFNILSNEKRGYGHSLYNKDEVQFIIQHLEGFYNDNCHHLNIVNNLSIGIITPYKQQQLKILDALKKKSYSLKTKNIEVATVDFYQGREKDIVVFSCVRAGGSKGIGFLSDIRRMNVAITRAKYSLWVIGNISSLQKNPDWEALIQYAKRKKCMKLMQYNKHAKQYKLVNNNHNNHNNHNMNMKIKIIPRPTLKTDNNNNNNINVNVKSMPMIIDYGDIRHPHPHPQPHPHPHPQQHIIHPRPHPLPHPLPPPLPPPHIQYRHPPNHQPQPQPQQHLIIHPNHHIHPQIIIPPPNHRLLIPRINQHIQQHNNNNNNNAFIDYTQTHMNSSAFDD